MNRIIWFKDCNYSNKELVGGKNASLGELVRLSQLINFNIADGFAISTIMYEDFIKINKIDEQVSTLLANMKYDDLEELEKSCKELRDLFINVEFTEEDKNLILSNYDSLCKLYGNTALDVAVRSSAVAEDLPNASFAGQQDTYLNVKVDTLIDSVKKCFASLCKSILLIIRANTVLFFGTGYYLMTTWRDSEVFSKECP